MPGHPGVPPDAGGDDLQQLAVRVGGAGALARVLPLRVAPVAGRGGGGGPLQLAKLVKGGGGSCEPKKKKKKETACAFPSLESPLHC